jgi:hypothetical protein
MSRFGWRQSARFNPETGDYAEWMARREGFADSLRSRCASRPEAAREEESQPEDDQ